jgi:hypothetical protein
MTNKPSTPISEYTGAMREMTRDELLADLREQKQWREHFETKYKVTKAACESALTENEKLRAYNDNSMVNKRNIGGIIIENQALRDQVSLAKSALEKIESNVIAIELNDDEKTQLAELYSNRSTLKFIACEALKTLEAKAEFKKDVGVK